MKESKLVLTPTQAALNESPSEKEGKFRDKSGRRF